MIFTEFLKIVINTIISILFIFLITKLIGVRQLSELSLFDYINGITIGSIAAEIAFAESYKQALLRLLSMILYGVFAVLVSYITDKSLKLRYLINGKPVLLMYEGNLIYNNFKKARIDINEFLVRARNNGYFDINEIHTAVFETNGKVSFLPKGDYKSVTPSDLKLKLADEYPVKELIIDGVVINKVLKDIGKNKEWLKSELKKQRITDISDVFLATYNIDGKLKVYSKRSVSGKN